MVDYLHNQSLPHNNTYSSHDSMEYLNDTQLGQVLSAKELKEALSARTSGDKFLDFFRKIFRMTTTKEVVTSLFKLVQEQGRLSAFKELRTHVNPQELSRFKLVVSEDNDVWSYEMKLGKVSLYSSQALPTGSGKELKEFKVASLLMDISDILGRREPAVDAEVELQQLAGSLQHKKVWDQFREISNCVAHLTKSQDNTAVPVTLQLNEERTGYVLSLDGTPVHTAVANDQKDHLDAAKCILNLYIDNYTNDQLSEYNKNKWREECVNHMSSNAETRSFIENNLSNQLFSRENFVRIDTVEGSNGEEFAAVFADLNNPFNPNYEETTVFFSNKTSDNGEFSGSLLRNEIENSSYDCLDDIITNNYLSENDANVMRLKPDLTNYIEDTLKEIATVVDDPSWEGKARNSINGIVFKKKTVGEIFFPEETTKNTSNIKIEDMEHDFNNMLLYP